MRTFLHFLLLSIFMLIVGGPIQTRAQTGTEEDKDLDTIELELDKRSQAVSSPKLDESAAAAEAQELREPEKLSDLSRLQSFSEISVIQKRFQPKSQRFQLFFGLPMVANDPWFTGVGLGAHLGYHFTESWGLEVQGFSLSTSEKEAVKDLAANNNVNTGSIITVRNYAGIEINWMPIYGKMSFLNSKIVPFDMYFSMGGGQIGLSNATSPSSTAFHLGTGQIFAFSKWAGLRWDISWNMYNATPNPSTATGPKPTQSQFNNLLFTIGASFFFPEATYR